MIQLLQSEQDAKKLLNFSVKIAKSMLFYGAEVYRVEDTVNRIYKSFFSFDKNLPKFFSSSVKDICPLVATIIS